jgi:hypothetical protein
VRAETRNSFAAEHDDAMDFPEPAGRSQPMPPSFPPPMPDVRMDEARMEEPASVVNHSAGEVISLDAMRNAMVANFEQSDLDVPAFLRKRGDVM